MLSVNNNQIEGPGLFFLSSTVDATETGVTNSGIIISFLYISGSRYAITHLGNTANFPAIISISNNICKFNISSAWLAIAVFRLASS